MASLIKHGLKESSLAYANKFTQIDFQFLLFLIVNYMNKNFYRIAAYVLTKYYKNSF